MYPYIYTRLHTYIYIYTITYIYVTTFPINADILELSLFKDMFSTVIGPAFSMVQDSALWMVPPKLANFRIP